MTVAALERAAARAKDPYMAAVLTKKAAQAAVILGQEEQAAVVAAESAGKSTLLEEVRQWMR